MLVLASAVVASLVGATIVVWLAPGIVPVIIVLSAGGALGVCSAVDEYGGLFVALTAIFATLGHGLYALHLFGSPIYAIAIVASLLVGVVFVILARMLIAAGSAEYPYDD